MSNTFEYQGFHFKPHKALTSKDYAELYKHLKRQKDFDKMQFSYKDFYNVTFDKECDIFLCLESKKLYLATDNGLMLYSKNTHTKKGQKYGK